MSFHRTCQNPLANLKRVCIAAVIAAFPLAGLTSLDMPTALASSNSHQLAPNAHVHVNWLFTKPGDYQADFSITIPYRVAENQVKTVTTEGTLNFQVGSEGTTSSGHYDFGPSLDGENQVSALVNGNDPSEIWFGLTDSAHKELPDSICSSLNLGSNCSGWVIPQSQESGIPWVGFNTQDAEILKIMAGPATFTLTNLSGPGDMYVWQDGNFGTTEGLWFSAGGDGSGAADIEENQESDPEETDEAEAAAAPNTAKTKTPKKKSPSTQPENKKAKAPKQSATETDNSRQENTPSSESNQNQAPVTTDIAPTPQNQQLPQTSAEPCYPIPSSQKFSLPLQTHVHPNWVFTQPGNYQVGIRQSAKINGQLQSADTILNFTVGGSGSANEGHFDLGVKVENSQLVATLKDDRTAGGTWVDPQSLTFGLGSGAQAKLPAGLEFLAPAGTPVWMIGSTQTSGVPWLGANTQHPSLLAATSEPVTWEMTSFRGPTPQARLAVFTSGNFGKVVGQKWFTAPASTTNVGRTASGKYCRLGTENRTRNANFSRATGGLAATGIGELTLPLSVLAGGIILLGLGMFFQAADRKNGRVAN